MTIGVNDYYYPGFLSMTNLRRICSSIFWMKIPWFSIRMFISSIYSLRCDFQIFLLKKSVWTRIKSSSSRISFLNFRSFAFWFALYTLHKIITFENFNDYNHQWLLSVLVRWTTRFFDEIFRRWSRKKILIHYRNAHS